MLHIRIYFLFLLFITVGHIQAQPFLHPGIDMNQKDLDYMKTQALAGEEPWSSAFAQLKRKHRLTLKSLQ